MRRVIRLTSILGAAAILAVAIPTTAMAAPGAGGGAGAATGALGSMKEAAAEKKIEVTWLGHATFEIVSPGGTRLLIDPFLTQNPKTPKRFKNLKRYRPDAILVTHSHMDHTADAAAIAKRSRAKLIGAYDHVAAAGVPADQQAGGNVGGTFEIGDVSVHLVPAMHGSTPGGRPLGFVIRFADGRSIYHTGDTWIFGDMALIQELFAPEIILLQVGGGPYNQDPATAALAIKKYFKPKVIVPMHFGTFGMLADEAAVTAAFKGDGRVRMMTPGETAKF